jgi:hypothetical protein
MWPYDPEISRWKQRFTPAERGPVAAPRSVPSGMVFRYVGVFSAVVLLANGPTPANHIVVEPFDPHFIESGLAEAEYGVELARHKLGYRQDMPDSPWGQALSPDTEFDLYMATHATWFLLGPLQPLLIRDIKDELGYEKSWTDFLGVLGPFGGYLSYFIDTH